MNKFMRDAELLLFQSLIIDEWYRFYVRLWYLYKSRSVKQILETWPNILTRKNCGMKNN